MFNPWAFWFFCSFPLLFAWVFAMVKFPETHCNFFYALMFPIIIMLGITGLGWSGSRPDDYWIKMPKARLARSGYFTLRNRRLCPAPTGKWSNKEKANLIFLFNGMEIETSFLDERGVRHELNFRVHFTALNDTPDQFSTFYHWYHELHVKMPNADAVFEHMKTGKDASLFRIEFPINLTIPAINA